MPAGRSQPLLFKDRKEWRAWLARYAMNSSGVWLVHFKKHAAQQGLTHEEAVEEALCFGWIDGQLKRRDEESYVLKYTPRQPGSVWSKINKDKALKLIALGRMAEAGLAKIEAAKQSGSWDRAYTNLRKEKMPADLNRALKSDARARKNFLNLANTYRNMYIGWVEQARTQETREQRVKEIVRRAGKNLKPGEGASLPGTRPGPVRRRRRE